jgi:hypothetical protein
MMLLILALLVILILQIENLITMKSITTYIKYASIISAVIPLGLFFYLRNIKNRIINLLAILILVAAVCDITSRILSSKKIPNLEIINTYFILQFIFAAVIYYHIYLKKRGSLQSILIAVASVVMILNTIFWQGLDSIQNISWAITSLVIIAMAFGHFLYLNRFPVLYPERSSSYWISTGLLFYCCLSFGIFVLSRFFIENLKLDADFRYVWMFHNLNNIFKNGCFFLAIWWSVYRDPAWDNPQTLKN